MRIGQRHREALEIIERTDGGATAGEIAEELGVQEQTANARMKYLRSHGLVEYSGSGAPGSPYVYEGPA